MKYPKTLIKGDITRRYRANNEAEEKKARELGYHGRDESPVKPEPKKPEPKPKKKAVTKKA